jgi:hypothetical protein
MEQNKNVIKRTYDAFINSDYEYGTISSTNLNPVREIRFDQIEIIRRRLQEITDDIVRRKIIKEPKPDKPIRVSLSPGALPGKTSMLRQAAQINSGSIALGVLFPAIDGPNDSIQSLLEPVIGSFPSQLILEELDHPLSLDCTEILKQYDFAEVDDVDNISDDSDDGSGSDTSDDSDEDGDDDSEEEDAAEEDEPPEDDDEENEFEECAMIEMDWLKIILIILRIIKILQMILDLILAILVPLLEIVLLALMCWLIPPAAEQLRQRITEMVMAIIIMIITKLIAMIFGLLNLDCLCDQTMNIINQIRQALSAFHSLMSVFNVSAVKMMVKNTLSQLQDPLDAIQEMYDQKAEAWEKMKTEWTNLDIKDMLKKSKDQIVSGAINAVSTDPNVQKVQQTIKAAAAAYNFMKKDVTDIISKMNSARKALFPPAPKPEPGAATEQDLLKKIGSFESE